VHSEKEGGKWIIHLILPGAVENDFSGYQNEEESSFDVSGAVNMATCTYGKD